MECADKDTKAFKSTDPLIKTIGALPQKSTDHAQNCYRCGRSNHTPANCKFKDARCLKCKKIGHIAPACQSLRAKPRPQQQKQADTPQKQADYQQKKHRTHNVQPDEGQLSDKPDSSDGDFKLHRVDKQFSDPINVTLWLNGQKLSMKVDTGATFSVISEATRQKVFPNETLHHSDLVLRTYTDEAMKVKGTLNMGVKY